MITRSIHRLAVVLAVAAFIFTSFPLAGCDKLQEAQEKIGLKNRNAQDSGPAAQSVQQPQPVKQELPAKTPSSVVTGTSSEPSPEAKNHIKQGLIYVSSAKNARNKALFDENIDNALKEFSLAIEKEPSYADAYSNRGAAYMQQRKFNKALEDLKKAKELAPASPLVHYNLACLYSLKRDVDLGMDELDTALTDGFNDYDSLRRDSDLNNLRKHPEFKRVLEKHKVFIAQ